MTFFQKTSSNDQNTPQGWPWIWAALLVFICLVTMAVKYAMPVRDGDIWWHMAYGRYFLENFTLIPDHTIFSWSPASNDQIYCAWIPEIIFYLLYQAAGLPLLFIVRYLCVLVLVFACFFYARSINVHRHPLVWLICLVAIILSYAGLFIKPEMFTYLFMILSSWLWWWIREKSEQRYLYFYGFPLIVLVWVNSHGGFIFGVIFFCVIAVGEFLNTWFSKNNKLPPLSRKHFCIALLLSLVAICITPYGIQYPLQLIHHLIPNAANTAYNVKISAYKAPFAEETPYHSFALYADMAILLLLYLYLKNVRKNTIEWSSILSNLIFAFLYTRFFRTTFYWAPVFMFSSIYLLKNDGGFIVKGAFCQWNKIITIGSILILSIMLSGYTIKKSICTPEPYSWMGFGVSEITPVDEVKYIQKYFPKSRIGNTYDEGGYMLWALWPEQKVFFDSRHFPYRQWSDEFFNFLYGNGVDEFTSKYDADIWCVGLKNLNLVNTFIQSDQWKIAFYGKTCMVAVRHDYPVPADAPLVSPNVFQVKNLANAIRVFLFACNIKDWPTAEKMIARLPEISFSDLSKEKIEKVEMFYKGLRAYYAGKYQEAYLNISSGHPDVINADLLLTKCLLFLAQQAWQNEDGLLAVKLNWQASLHSKGNLFSAYNSGIMAWYDWYSSDTSQILSTEDDDYPWQKDLNYFLQYSSKRYEQERVIAQEILAGHYQQRPVLLVPDRPPITLE